jgi:hypothetical protein
LFLLLRIENYLVDIIQGEQELSRWSTISKRAVYDPGCEGSDEEARDPCYGDQVAAIMPTIFFKVKGATGGL